MNTMTPAADRLERFKGYLLEDPDNLALRADVFDLALQLGRFDLAQEQADAALEHDPLDRRWRQRVAVLRMQQGEYALAEHLFGELIDEGVDDPRVLCELGRTLFRHGKFEQAAARLRPLVDGALSRVPDALELWLRCEQRLGLLDEAVEVFAQHAHEVEATPSAWGVASLLAFDNEQLARARSWAGFALRLAPTQREAMVTMGTLALERQDIEGALVRLEQCTGRYPREMRAWSALGMAYLRALRLRDAVAALEQAILLDPGYINTWHALGWSQVCLNLPADARASFEQALELDRNFGDSHGGLAVSLAMLGQRELAAQHAERALRLDPSSLSGRFAKALLDGDVGETAAFEKMARRVLGQSRTAGGQPMADVVLAASGLQAR